MAKTAERAFKAQTITEFKGLNASGSIYNGYGGDEKEAMQLVNFNVTPEGYLEKRKGINLFTTLTAPIPGHSRYVGQLRELHSPRKVWLYFSDFANLFRCDQDGNNTSVVLQQTSNAAVQGINAVFPVGVPGNYYHGAGLSVFNGIIGITGNVPTASNGFIPSTPKGDHGMMFKNRAWVINTQGIDGEESRLYFSAVGNLNDWSSGGSAGGGNIFIDVADGDFLNGMIPYNDNLILFKSKKTYSFSADSEPSSWTYRLISDRVGCIAFDTVRLINGFLYFLSMDGVYKTDGTTYHLISEPVNELFQGFRDLLNPGGLLSAVYYDGKYVLFIPKDMTAPQPETDQAIVYDIATEQWTVWDFNKAVTGITVLGSVRLPEANTDRLVMGSWGSNKVWVMNTSFQDNGFNYPCVWQGRRQDFGDIVNKKRNHLVGVVGSHDSVDPGSLTVDVVADDTTTVTTTESAAKFSDKLVKVRGAGYGRYFQTKVSFTSSKPFSMYGITWMNEARGIQPNSGPNKNV